MHDMTMAEAVERYNELADQAGYPRVKRFKSKAEAFKRIQYLEMRKSWINWPFRGVQHKVLPNTLNHQLVAALRKGATRSDLAGLVMEWDARTGNKARLKPSDRVQQMIRQLHTYNGYGIRQEGEKLWLVEE
jgi:hypothetical protein